MAHPHFTSPPNDSLRARQHTALVWALAGIAMVAFSCLAFGSLIGAVGAAFASLFFLQAAHVRFPPAAEGKIQSMGTTHPRYRQVIFWTLWSLVVISTVGTVAGEWMSGAWFGSWETTIRFLLRALGIASLLLLLAILPMVWRAPRRWRFYAGAAIAGQILGALLFAPDFF